MRQNVPWYRWHFVVGEAQVLRPTQTGKNVTVHEPANDDYDDSSDPLTTRWSTISSIVRTARDFPRAVD
jgi:predicted RNA-binding protein with PUA-like domain